MARLFQRHSLGANGLHFIFHSDVFAGVDDLNRQAARRRMLGDLLLELNRPDKALEAYERSLKDSPNRLNGLSGAARAAELSGDRAKAREYYVKVGALLQ